MHLFNIEADHGKDLAALDVVVQRRHGDTIFVTSSKDVLLRVKVRLASEETSRDIYLKTQDLQIAADTCVTEGLTGSKWQQVDLQSKDGSRLQAEKMLIRLKAGDIISIYGNNQVVRLRVESGDTIGEASLHARRIRVEMEDH